MVYHALADLVLVLHLAFIVFVEKSMNERTARCCCGDVSIRLRGEPERVIRCHCQYCQRRTGNVFQVSAWFFEDQIVSRTGEARVFNDSANNAGVDYTFCTRCGSTVYWPIKPFPGLYGVAVGCFADPGFPPPNFELHGKHRHARVQDLDRTRPQIAGIKSILEFDRLRPMAGECRGLTVRRPDYLRAKKSKPTDSL